MKAALLPCLVIVIILSSCKKEFSKPLSLISSSTELYLKSDATGVNLSDAKEVAIRFLKTKVASAKIAVNGTEHNTPVVTVRNAQTIINKQGKPYFHIINTDKGFVILSPDSLYCPILAYDSIGNFSFAEKDLNPGLLRWLNKNAYELDYMRNNKGPKIDSIGSKNKMLWRFFGGQFEKSGKRTIITNAGKYTVNNVRLYIPPPTLIASDPIYYSTNSTVGPLCPTYWEQGDPYNQYCPAGNWSGGHMPTGCLPTAMAQIMYFWQWPNTYNWSSMVKFIDPSDPNTWPFYNPGGFTESARLMSDIGTTSGPVFINATSGFSTSQFAYYQDGGTSAEDAYCPYVFGVFNYTSASRTETISDQILYGEMSGTSYSGLLTNELQTYNRPCILSGYTDEQHPWYLGLIGLLLWVPTGTGHSWVCDGSNVTTFYSGHRDTYQSYYGDITYETYYDMLTTYSLLHMNWGWGSSLLGGPANNGWYNCNIDYTTAPDGRNFSLFQTIIYNIHP